mmetsp:Transcript_3193/g.3559  ORF Transcript_3193/g.3559 Transcript_3193/m.3559 type:complete len:84 (+) Transcript_3193:106-357(+)|eukprot:CAMPEP_0198252150 /NCGR_PEP_ID=MMETSP1447-20131203/2726_1 /TAXON_ID=420782 /ORGANISM="Chaetoceros dichaeta, Strain CCMP1751" /LENGTH=83 /DNA_ID=CAMNT_0043937317 /DNA_START=6 /DNA_END=257 /DNA_ORIENTATION=+
MALSKTNTDSQCLDTSKSSIPFLTWFRKVSYFYNLWTGMYMLERHERWSTNVLFGSIAIMGILYTSVFWRGVYDGWTDVLEKV